MNRLDGIAAEDLREALEDVEGQRPTLRLVAAITYDAGVPQSRIAEWFGVSRSTVYNWLERFERAESRSLAEAASDEPRSGRPPKLDPAQRSLLRSTLSSDPKNAGFEASAWTGELVRQYVDRKFGVEYSHRHARALLEDLG